MPTGVCAKERLAGIYRPRYPRNSPLYRIFEDHFERFLIFYEEQFERTYGPLRGVVKRARDQVLRVRDPRARFCPRRL
jgi:hypothetical protein